MEVLCFYFFNVYVLDALNGNKAEHLYNYISSLNLQLLLVAIHWIQKWINNLIMKRARL